MRAAGPAQPLFGQGVRVHSDSGSPRVAHALEVPLLEELVACGAPAEILYDARAHLGTDRLHRILPVFRARLEAAGVLFHFDTRVEGLVLRAGSGAAARVVALSTSAGEIGCDAVVLAPGHSARDTWRALAGQGVALEAKPFQLGVRVEHPQALIDAGRYGNAPEAKLLGPRALVCSSDGGLPALQLLMCQADDRASVNAGLCVATAGARAALHPSRCGHP
jgi:uncharacterized FAD-dependent dehydrogenase